MKAPKIIFIFVLALLILALGLFLRFERKTHNPINTLSPSMPELPVLTIHSPAFTYGGNIPAKFTCDGQNTNPELNIAGIADQAKSLVLLVEDPDAPLGTWTHWIVFNLPPETARIGEGEKPTADYGLNSFGTLDYGGPCPPNGEHRYFFKLYTLDAKIDLPSGTKRTALEAALAGHILQTAELMGKYKR